MELKASLAQLPRITADPALIAGRGSSRQVALAGRIHVPSVIVGSVAKNAKQGLSFTY